MNEPRWISRRDCVIIHEMMLARHGGAAGIRDETALESALAAPRTRFASGRANLGELAACYTSSILTLRPFESGNACTAFLLAATFLRVNGLVFIGHAAYLVEETLALAEGRSSEAYYATFLTCNSQPP
jgi:death-on-curing protein